MNQQQIDTDAPTVNMKLEEQGEQAIAKFEMQALAPIRRKDTLRAMLGKYVAEIAGALPRHINPDRMIKAALLAVQKEPKLLECTQLSFLEAVMRASELGLDIGGTKGEAYLVPFNNKGPDDKYRLEATMIPGYRGLAKLARQSGDVVRIEAEAVHQHDLFEYEKGMHPKCRLVPKLDGDRGPVLGYYALAHLKGADSVQTDYMTRSQVETVRQRAQSKNSPAWRNHFDEMGRKTVFRRLAKWLPLESDPFLKAIEADNQDFDFDAHFEVLGDDDGPGVAGVKTKLAKGGNGNGADVAPAAAEPGEPLIDETTLAELRHKAKRMKIKWASVEEEFGGPLDDPEAGITAANVHEFLDSLGEQA